MNFIKWLIKEEEGKIFAYKSKNAKGMTFVVLYGGTRPFSNQLGSKGLKFRYFNGTWSMPESMFTDEVRKKVEEMGADLSGLEAEASAAASTAHIAHQATSAKPEGSEDTSKTDQILQNMKDNLDAAMKSEGSDSKLKNLVANIERMIEHVASSTDEASKQEFLRNFLKFSSKFHNYSMSNQMLIWAQTKGKAEHVASATNWVSLGRKVRNWDESIMIFAPNFKNIEKENPQTGEKEKQQLKFFKPVKVFDISATEPIPGHKGSFQPVSRKDWSKDSNEDIEELNVLVNSLTKFIEEKKINVNYEELSDEMGGYSAGGKIAINNKFKGINLFSTLVHETAHEILHWLEQNSNKRSELGVQSTRKQKEIDAETTAFIVCHHFGFETKDTPNYLALWQAKGDEIRERKQNIHKASKMIIEGIHQKVTETEMDFGVEEIEENTSWNRWLNKKTISEVKNRYKALSQVIFN
jgi:hypothetical protein